MPLTPIVLVFGMFLAYLIFSQILKGNELREAPELDEKLRYLYQGLGRLPYAPYEMSPFVKMRLQDIWTDETVIHELVLDIMKHLGMPADSVKVHVTFIPDELVQETVGNFEEGASHNEIWISIKRRYSLENILSIVCHECSHHVLYSHDLEFADPTENEILTDVAAMYFGFGAYMLEGYQPSTVKTSYLDENGKKMQKLTYIKVGYLDTKQLKFIQQRINAQMGW